MLLATLDLGDLGSEALDLLLLSGDLPAQELLHGQELFLLRQDLVFLGKENVYDFFIFIHFFFGNVLL